MFPCSIETIAAAVALKLAAVEMQLYMEVHFFLFDNSSSNRDGLCKNGMKKFWPLTLKKIGKF